MRRNEPGVRFRASFIFFTILTLSLPRFLQAEDAGWVIAAESFTASGVPSVYGNVPDVLPRLILSRIVGIRERMVLPDENELRALQSLSDERLKLVRERAELVRSRDRVVLSSDDFLVKKRNRNESERKIRDKEKAIRDLDKKTTALIEARSSEKNAGKKEFAAGVRAIQLWKDGKELYKRADTGPLAPALSKDGISALLSGTVEDIAGYLYVTVTLDTGIDGLRFTEVSEASSYDDIGELAAALTVRLLPGIANREPVLLELKAEPEGAQIFIDGKLVPKGESSVTVFSGEHTVSVSAPGYATATRKARFEGAKTWRVSIALEEEKTISVAFDTAGGKAQLFFHTQYIGETPAEVKLPRVPTVGELVTGDVETWFVFMPAKDTLDGARLTVKPRTNDVGKLIEKRRNAFYWSLGALYLSIPVSMLTYGIALDKSNAYAAGKLGGSEDAAADVNNWIRASQVSRGVSLVLGVNVAIQLVRYILAANEVIPEFAESDSKR